MIARPSIQSEVLLFTPGSAWITTGLALLLSALPALGAAPGAAASPVADAAPGPADLIGPLFRMLLALVVVLGVLAVIVWGLRNGSRLLPRKGPGPRLRILEARSLGGRNAIHLVGYEDQRFLIGSSPAGVTLLSVLPPSTAAPDPEVIPSNFADALQAALQGRGS